MARGLFIRKGKCPLLKLDTDLEFETQTSSTALGDMTLFGDPRMGFAVGVHAADGLDCLSLLLCECPPTPQGSLFRIGEAGSPRAGAL